MRASTVLSTLQYTAKVSISFAQSPPECTVYTMLSLTNDEVHAVK